MRPELPGKGCENFLVYLFISVCIGMPGNYPGGANTIVLGLLIPRKDIRNLKSSDSDQNFEFQFLVCFRNILITWRLAVFK